MCELQPSLTPPVPQLGGNNNHTTAMTTTSLPATMRSLALEKYTAPANYKLLDLPLPAISSPNDVLVRVHAAGINAGDCKIASGSFHFMMASTFPYKFAHDLSGTVAAVGDDVSEWQVGDEVFTMLPITRGGAASEYAVVTADRLCRKPSNISHTEAAALPQVSVSALQVLERANTMMGGGLQGKTVFISAGLGGIGGAAILLARNVFGVGKIITTVSTAKVARIPEMLGAGTVDQVIDYMKEDVLKCVEKESVDFYFDTASTVFGHLPLMKHGGLVSSVTSMCPGSKMEELMPTPWLVKGLLNIVFYINRWRVRRFGADFDVQLTILHKGDLGKLATWVEEGKYKAVIGRKAKLADLDEVLVGCTEIEQRKGVTGKFVIEIV